MVTNMKNRITVSHTISGQVIKRAANPPDTESPVFMVFQAAFKEQLLLFNVIQNKEKSTETVCLFMVNVKDAMLHAQVAGYSCKQKLHVTFEDKGRFL